jgi:hypothetical protein
LVRMRVNLPTLNLTPKVTKGIIDCKKHSANVTKGIIDCKKHLTSVTKPKHIHKAKSYSEQTSVLSLQMETAYKALNYPDSQFNLHCT